MTMQAAVTTALSQRSATKTLAVSIRRTGPHVRQPDSTDAPASAWQGLVPSIWTTPSSPIPLRMG
jgi:hypothetical protein